MKSFFKSVLAVALLSSSGCRMSLEKIIDNNISLASNLDERDIVEKAVIDEAKRISGVQSSGLDFVNENEMPIGLAGLYMSEDDIRILLNRRDVIKNIELMAHELGHAGRSFDDLFCNAIYQSLGARSSFEKMAIVDLICESQVSEPDFLKNLTSRFAAEAYLNEMLAITFSKAVVANLTQDSKDISSILLSHLWAGSSKQYANKYASTEILGILLSKEFHGDLESTAKYLLNAPAKDIVDRISSFKTQDMAYDFNSSLDLICQKYGLTKIRLNDKIVSLCDVAKLVISYDETKALISNFGRPYQLQMLNIRRDDKENLIVQDYFRMMLKYKVKEVSSIGRYKKALANMQLSNKAQNYAYLAGRLGGPIYRDSINYMVRAFTKSNKFAKKHADEVFDWFEQIRPMMIHDADRALLYSIQYHSLLNSEGEQSAWEYLDKCRLEMQMDLGARTANPDKINTSLVIQDQIQSFTNFHVNMINDVRNHEMFIIRNLKDMDIQTCKDYLKIIDTLRQNVFVKETYKTDINMLLGLYYDAMDDQLQAKKYYEKVARNHYFIRSPSLEIAMSRMLEQRGIYDSGVQTYVQAYLDGRITTK